MAWGVGSEMVVIGFLQQGIKDITNAYGLLNQKEKERIRLWVADEFVDIYIASKNTQK